MAASSLARPARLIRSTVSSSKGTDFPSSSARKPSATPALRSVMCGLFVNDKRIPECRTSINWQSLPSSFFFYKSRRYAITEYRDKCPVSVAFGIYLVRLQENRALRATVGVRDRRDKPRIIALDKIHYRRPQRRIRRASSCTTIRPESGSSRFPLWRVFARVLLAGQPRIKLLEPSHY
jgi:hypothetical protein